METVHNFDQANRSNGTTSVKDVYTPVDRSVDNSTACEFKNLHSQLEPQVSTEFSWLSTVIHRDVHMYIFSKILEK